MAEFVPLMEDWRIMGISTFVLRKNRVLVSGKPLMKGRLSIFERLKRHGCVQKI